jgi:hypothetical protein
MHFHGDNNDGEYLIKIILNTVTVTAGTFEP